MAGAFPINWGFGGIAWNKFDGVRSLYVALRFRVDGPDVYRPPIGFIVRIGDQRRALYSARRKSWLFGRVQIVSYGA